MCFVRITPVKVNQLDVRSTVTRVIFEKTSPAGETLTMMLGLRRSPCILLSVLCLSRFGLWNVPSRLFFWESPNQTTHI